MMSVIAVVLVFVAAAAAQTVGPVAEQPLETTEPHVKTEVTEPAGAPEPIEPREPIKAPEPPSDPIKAPEPKEPGEPIKAPELPSDPIKAPEPKEPSDPIKAPELPSDPIKAPEPKEPAEPKEPGEPIKVPEPGDTREPGEGRQNAEGRQNGEGHQVGEGHQFGEGGEAGEGREAGEGPEREEREPIEPVFGRELLPHAPFPHNEHLAYFPFGKLKLLAGSAFVIVHENRTCERVSLTEEAGGACPLNQTLCNKIAATQCRRQVANVTCFTAPEPGKTPPAGQPTNVPAGELGNHYQNGGPLCHVKALGYKFQPSARSAIFTIGSKKQTCVFSVTPGPAVCPEQEREAERETEPLSGDPPCPFIES